VSAGRTGGLRRVAFVYEHHYPESLGGAERYYWRIAQALAAHRPVTQLTSSREGRWQRTETGVELISVAHSHPKTDMLRGRILARLAFTAGVGWHLLRHGRRYAVVHVAWLPYGVLLVARAALWPHPCTTLIGDWHEVSSAESWRRRRGRAGALGWALERVALRSQDVAVCFSGLAAGRLRREIGHRPVAIVPEFLPEPATPSVHGATRGAEPIVLFAGRLAEEKRPWLVIDTLAELRRRNPRWRAQLFGDGPERGRIQDRIAELGLGDAVDLRGRAPFAELSAAMLNAAVLLHPSVREGFGLVVLEASAHGLPTVLVAEPDNAAVELIEPGVNGRVCQSAGALELADAVQALGEDGAASLRTRHWAETSGRHYTVETARAALEALHAELGST